MQDSAKQPRIHIILNNENVKAFNYLKTECAYNVSELFRRFLMNLYEEEKAKRSLA